MMEYSSTLTIRVGRRPQRSAARPNRKAPIGRIASVSRMANVTSEMSVLNSCAMSLSTNTRRKKSKASSVHPRKLATMTSAARWSTRSARQFSSPWITFVPLPRCEPCQQFDDRFGDRTAHVHGNRMFVFTGFLKGRELAAEQLGRHVTVDSVEHSLLNHRLFALQIDERDPGPSAYCDLEIRALKVRAGDDAG